MTKKNYALSQAIYLALGALLLLFTGGRFNFWLAPWFSSVFFIRFAREKKPLIGYLCIVAVSWGVSVFSWYGIQPAGLIFHMINMLIGSLFGTLPLLLSRIFIDKVPKSIRSLVFPVFATALEYIFISGNPMGSFGSIAYTQYANLPFIQITSLVGMMGITFIMSWFAAVINELWNQEWRIKEKRGLLLSLGLTLLFSYTYGGLRLLKSNIPEGGETIEIAMIIRSEADLSIRDVMALEGEKRFELADRMFDKFLENTSLLEADIFCWPEAAIITTSRQFSIKEQRLQEYCRDNGIYLVAPYFIIPEQGQIENKLALYTPTGDTAFYHTKYGGNIFEGSVPGNGELQYADTELGRISALICWDMDFPSPVRQAGMKQVDILFSPSSEWREIVPVHAQMAVFRGIENGVITVHPASLGYSVIADPYGREIDSLNWYRDSEETIKTIVPINGGIDTLYSRMGDLFPNLVMVSALVIILLSIILKRKGKGKDEQ